MLSTFLKSQNCLKERLKKDRLLVLMAEGKEFAEKLGPAYKAITYHS